MLLALKKMMGNSPTFVFLGYLSIVSVYLKLVVSDCCYFSKTAVTR